MSSNGYAELRPAAVDEDYIAAITVEGEGSLSGWTLAGKLWDTDGTEIAGALTASVTDADARVITLVVAGQALPAVPYYLSYKFEVRRTDVGSRTLVAWGVLDLTNPNS